ncbi:uridine kinase-like, CYTH-like domain, P-loop containing nucleoside triphosphate hydrolase [Artemisia annua]|uniref:Uridine kinase-like, CYTH-like domain, P-loop containing nucleoside triphosphate hydrolase n=1 Tax=Artemisia annua TaxID=35608 RepID=A0A2U1NLS0_ARTAN|nr:uridine kinase-like, CYTH-like domain, P-loop containing nucleoside triphosphate hydrolase [Artemisia annua]
MGAQPISVSGLPTIATSQQLLLSFLMICVYSMYKAIIEPSLKTTHIRILNKLNPFTVFQIPDNFFKDLSCSDQVMFVMSKEHIKTLKETFDIYLLPPGEHPRTCQSYLRIKPQDWILNIR